VLVYPSHKSYSLLQIKSKVHCAHINEFLFWDTLYFYRSVDFHWTLKSSDGSLQSWAIWFEFEIRIDISELSTIGTIAIFPTPIINVSTSQSTWYTYLYPAHFLSEEMTQLRFWNGLFPLRWWWLSRVRYHQHIVLHSPTFLDYAVYVSSKTITKGLGSWTIKLTANLNVKLFSWVHQQTLLTDAPLTDNGFARFVRAPGSTAGLPDPSQLWFFVNIPQRPPFPSVIDFCNYIWIMYNLYCRTKSFNHW